MSTHSFTVLDLSPAAFDEIKSKLLAAGYNHVFVQVSDKLVIDMNGLAVSKTVDGDNSTVPTS